ncbi:MAG: Rpn family recombination-promoting nuclease/putative transposase [Lachnospiraceae bacterium]
MNYKIIPMTNDRVFKSVLSSIEARDYLIDIISGITGLPKANLKKDMTFVDSEHRISSKNESKKISDLVVEVKDNVINLEMNNTYYKKLVDRNFEYIAKLKSNLIGESYNKIRKVIQINFDNFNRYNDDRVVIKFEMRDEKGIKEGVSLESYHVILPNVKEKYYNENNKDDLIGKLVIFVAERDEELQKLIDKHIELRPVGKKLVEISREEEARGIYDLEEHERRVRNSLIEDALEDGWNRGKKEGKEEGIKEGIKENKLSVAKKLSEEGISLDIIKKVTNLSDDDIKALK